MAQIQSTLGNIKGKIGHVVIYQNKEGKNLMRSSGCNYKIKSEARKQSTTTFCTVAHCKQWMQEVIRIGFPGNNRLPQGNAGFMHANATAATVVRDENNRKYKGYVEPAKLLVAAGILEKPDVTLDINTTERTLTFRNHGSSYDKIDCFTTDRIYATILSFSTYSCQIIGLGTRGTDNEITVTLKPHIPTDDISVYIFATRTDGRSASDSVCLYTSHTDREKQNGKIITENFQ